MSEWINTITDTDLRKMENSSNSTIAPLGLITTTTEANTNSQVVLTSDQIREQVQQLYIIFFGRPADTSGMIHWTNMIANGYSMTDVSRDFSLSQEWTSQHDNLTTEQQIEHFYKNAFNRSADASGQKHWQDMVDAGTPFYEVARIIASSAYTGGAGIGVDDYLTIHAKVDGAKNASLGSLYASLNTTSSATGQTGNSDSSSGGNVSPNPEPEKVASLSYSASTFTESESNDGSIVSSIKINLLNDTFSDTATSNIATNNVPAGLTAHFERTNDTTITFSLLGTATHHANINDVNNLSVIFQDQAFSQHASASSVTGYTNSNVAIDFINSSTSDSGDSGSGSGGGSGGDSNNGDLYGDQYVLLRDLNPLDGGGDGQPILDGNGQVILIGTDGNPIYFVQNVDGDYEIPADKLDLAQTVELERANVARAPTSVMTKSLASAMDKIDIAENVDTDPAGRIVCDGATIDSPLENLALYQYLMTAGNASSWPAVVDAWPEKIKALLGDNLLNPDWSPASLMGAAVSKESPITMDAVIYESTTLGVNTVTQIDGEQHIDYFQFTNGVTESFNYDRAAHYAGVWIQWYAETDGDLNNLELVKDTLMHAVFNDEIWLDQYVTVSSDPTKFETIDAMNSGLNDFSQAAEDSRAIINFMHESYGAVRIDPPQAVETVLLESLIDQSSVDNPNVTAVDATKVTSISDQKDTSKDMDSIDINSIQESNVSDDSQSAPNTYLVTPDLSNCGCHIAETLVTEYA